MESGVSVAQTGMNSIHFVGEEMSLIAFHFSVPVLYYHQRRRKVVASSEAASVTSHPQHDLERIALSCPFSISSPHAASQCPEEDSF